MGSTFYAVLQKYRTQSFSERDKGDRFERLMKAYLLTDALYAHTFEKVWMWSEFPYKSDFGGKDTGIDLVALANKLRTLCLFASKSAIEWVMERYKVTTHKESGITNNPNHWATEVGNPRYILDLLLSVINVSVQTVQVVENLPKVRF